MCHIWFSPFDQLPILRELSGTSDQSCSINSGASFDTVQQAKILRVCSAIYKDAHQVVRHTILSTCFVRLQNCLCGGDITLLKSACQFLTCIATYSINETMMFVYAQLIPVLEDIRCDQSRLGAIHALHELVLHLGLNVVPYVSFMVVPVLGRMSDSNALFDRSQRVVLDCWSDFTTHLTKDHHPHCCPRYLSKNLLEIWLANSWEKLRWFSTVFHHVSRPDYAHINKKDSIGWLSSEVSNYRNFV